MFVCGTTLFSNQIDVEQIRKIKLGNVNDVRK